MTDKEIMQAANKLSDTYIQSEDVFYIDYDKLSRSLNDLRQCTLLLGLTQIYINAKQGDIDRDMAIARQKEVFENNN